MKFNVDQTARGILATISNGDWSLAASRLKLAGTKRAQISALVERALSPAERLVWARYTRKAEQ